jgi:hypothetical protein
VQALAVRAELVYAQRGKLPSKSSGISKVRSRLEFSALGTNRVRSGSDEAEQIRAAQDRRPVEEKRPKDAEGSLRGTQIQSFPEACDRGWAHLRRPGRRATRAARAEPAGARGENPYQHRNGRAHRGRTSTRRRAHQRALRGAHSRARRPHTPACLSRPDAPLATSRARNPGASPSSAPPASSVRSVPSDCWFAPALGSRGDRRCGDPSGGCRHSTVVRRRGSRFGALRAGLQRSGRSCHDPPRTCGGPEGSRCRGAKGCSGGARAGESRRRCRRGCSREKREESGREGAEQLVRESAGPDARRIISLSLALRRGRWIGFSPARRPTRDRDRGLVRRMRPRTPSSHGLQARD